MNHHSYSLKTRFSGVFLAILLLIAPVVASADTISEITAKLAEVSASLSKIISSVSAITGTQQAQVAGTSGALSLTVLSPNGGETLFVGDTKTITWNSSSVIDKVSIMLKTDPNHGSWVANNIPNTNSFSWKVDSLGWTDVSQFKIWIIGYQTGTGSVTDESDNFFSVHSIANKTDLEIFKLCFGKYVTAGDSCARSDFDASGFINITDLGLLKSAILSDLNGDSIADLRDTADNADLNFFKSCFGQYTASVPSCTKADLVVNGVVNASDLAKFKSAIKYDLNGDSRVDMRENVTPLPTITSFVVSDSNDGSSVRTFSWASSDATSIDFIIDCANGLTIQNTDNTPFECSIKHSMTSNGQKAIKFQNITSAPVSIIATVRAVGSSSYNPEAKNVSLTILPTPVLTVLAPNGGETWDIGGIYPIAWNSINLPLNAPIEIEIQDTRFSGDTPESNSTIIKTTNTGIYSWAIPSSMNQYMTLGAGNVYKIWVRSSYGLPFGAYEDGSNSTFTIPPPSSIGSISVLSPNGGESFAAGSVIPIKWTSGDPGISRIDLINADGSYNQTIYSDKVFGYPVPNTSGIFSFQTFFSHAGQYYVKIYQYGSDKTDKSDSIFTITSLPSLSLTVTSPNGGETLFTGDTKTITWNSSSVIDKVSIGWSTGPGSLNWIANNIPNTNSYNWTVNVGNTTNTQFKIWIIGYQTGTGSVTDESDNFFSVHSIANKTDLEIFKLCFGKYVTAGDSCARSDFDASGFINITDLGLLKSAILSDLNGDSIADLRDTADNADLNFFKSCFGQYTASSTSCVKADLDSSGFINSIDLGKFKSAIKYDLNGDSRVDMRESTAVTSAPSTPIVIPETSIPIAPTISLSATPAVTYNGSASLTWFSANAKSCKADGGWSGEKTTSGTETVTGLTAPLTTFFLTCSGEGGSQTMQISVIAKQETSPEISEVPKLTTQAPTPKTQIFTERNLYRGMKGDGVRKLQELLARDSQVYPSGLATGYFGYLTEAAIQNFQCKYEIACDGNPESTGYGIVGPKTMEKINEVFGGINTNTESTSTNDVAITVADLQTQVEALLKQLSELTTKLNALPR